MALALAQPPAVVASVVVLAPAPTVPAPPTALAPRSAPASANVPAQRTPPGRIAGQTGPAGPTGIPLLVERARDGDAEAFGELYGIYADTVFRYIYRRVSHQQLAEDLCSETFLRALRRISSFAWQGRDIIAWLQTIARNLVIDHYKSAMRRAETPTGEFEEAREESKGGPEEVVLTEMARNSLYEALDHLLPAQRQCVTLRLLDGRSVDETARIMGRTRGAITTLQCRSLRALQRVLREQDAPNAMM